jgi:hypothetical protein
VRQELGFGRDDPAGLDDILKVRYRACRYAFGYPAAASARRGGADRLGGGRAAQEVEQGGVDLAGMRPRLLTLRIR